MKSREQSPPGERLRFAQWAGREEMSDFVHVCVVLLPTTLIRWHVEQEEVTSMSGLNREGLRRNWVPRFCNSVLYLCLCLFLLMPALWSF